MESPGINLQKGGNLLIQEALEVSQNQLYMMRNRNAAKPYLNVKLKREKLIFAKSLIVVRFITIRNRPFGSNKFIKNFDFDSMILLY